MIPNGVSVVGLGKLGAPMAACFAARGLRTVGVDTDQTKVDALAAGLPPVFEPGLAELLAEAGGRLSATTSVHEAAAATDLTAIVVPTPSEPTGEFTLRFVLSACEAVGTALAEKDAYHVVVITSTVMPGSTDGPIRETLEQASGKRIGVDFGLCYSPEFIALGSVIRDFLNPDFVLIGESDPRAGDLLAHLYATVCENAPHAARMNFVNAELAKLSLNSYVTTKITFANQLARICEATPGANVDAVTAAIGLDSRIGAKYLIGAVPYGGPCFPRDNVALAAHARSAGAPADLAEATERFNQADLIRLRDRVLETVANGETIAVLGLSYKPGSDVIDESPGVALVRDLTAAGADVIAHDPVVNAAAARVLDGSNARFAATVEDCIAQADVVVVVTPWPEFASLAGLLAGSRVRRLIDCWRMFGTTRIDGVEYEALGVAGESILDSV